MSPLPVIVAALLLAVAYATWKAPRLTSVLVWSFLATLILSAALLLTLPAPFSEKALWLALAVPLIWTGFQFWCYWDGKPRRVAIGLILITLVSGALVAVSEPPV